MTRLSEAQPPFAQPNVADVFDGFPDPARATLLALRAQIFEVAEQTPGVGQLTETLKWGQPAYLTAETGSGSTLRLGLPKTGGAAIYCHCQTTILSDFRMLHPTGLHFEGSRGIRFPDTEDMDPLTLRPFIHLALTYHLRKRVRSAAPA